MGLCDWQCLSRGHWARDFAYAVTAALPVEDRRAWEKDLLSSYLDALEAAGGPRVPFDVAWLRYRQQTPGALVMWTPVLRHSPLLPDMQPEDVSIEMIRRMATAIDDLEALDATGDG